MKFNVSITYGVVTSASAIDGDFAETGFEIEDQEYTLSELKHLIKSGGYCRERNRGGNKSSPCSTWMHREEEDIYEGTTTTYGLHISKI